MELVAARASSSDVRTLERLNVMAPTHLPPATLSAVPWGGVLQQKPASGVRMDRSSKPRRENDLQICRRSRLKIWDLGPTAKHPIQGQLHDSSPLVNTAAESGKAEITTTQKVTMLRTGRTFFTIRTLLRGSRRTW